MASVMWGTWNKWLTLSHVLHDVIKGKKNKENKEEKHGDDKWQRRKVEGSFPHLIHTGRRS